MTDRVKTECLDSTSVVKQLMTIYNKYKAPSFREPVIVTVQIGVQEIGAISDSTADFEITIFIYEEWLDSRLRYLHLNPCAANVTLIDERLDLLWTPNTCFVNNKFSLLLHTPFRNAKMVLYPDGMVSTSYRMTLVGPCEMDLKAFPMDTVRCSLTFESFNYNVDEVHMKWRKWDPVFLEHESRYRNYASVGKPLPSYLNMPAMKTSDFRLVNISTSAVAYDYPAGYWDELTVTFTFQRRIGWYMLQAYFPTYLVIFISWISFCLGTGMSARAMLGVNTLLALTFQFGNVIKNLPRVSYVKAIDVWMLSCMTFIFCNLLELTLVAYITAQRQLTKAASSLAERCGGDTHFLAHGKFKARMFGSLTRMSTDQIDKVSAVAFPLCFLLFNIAYWNFYVYR
uniref:Neurotransmitter-gated ion-channel ligand-binding domain-containing protein n=1 Tax=Trichuris muris TaxID=70415 RepID=A0A5S6R2Q7_TRIMR